MALANADQIVAQDDRTSSYAAYAIYESGRPVRVLLYNSDYHTNGTRPLQSYTLFGLSSERVIAKRLTAPYSTSRVDEGESPSLGGQRFGNGDCVIQGTPEVETATVSQGEVTVSTPPRHTRSGSRQSGLKCATRACDQCRLRKTRCSLSRPCQTCVNLGFDCTFLQPQRRRGPTPHRVAQIRRQQDQSPRSPSRSPSDVPGVDATASHLASLETPGTIAGLHPTGQDKQVDQHFHTDHLGNPPREVYSNGMLDNATPAPTTWNEGPNLDYWLPDNFSSPECPSFGFQGSNIFVRHCLPPVIDENVSLQLANSPSLLTTNMNAAVPPEDVSQVRNELWPPYINEASLIPWIDVYFDRLHPTLPVLNRSSLFTRIMQQDHRRNAQFGAMILSLCAFSLTQPIDISERPTSSSRTDQAKVLVNEATRMRTSPDFGENPSIEAVLTSFFLFGYLFGSNQHNAARLRLREAMDLASTLGLNNPTRYADRSNEEKGQWLRTYLVLSVTERAYALQRQHPITFTGRPLEIIRAADEIRNATQRLVHGIIVHTEKDAIAMMGLSLLMEIFDTIDEDILICWNGRCNVSSHGKCQILTEAKALSIYRNLARVTEAGRYNCKADHFDPDSDPGPVTGGEASPSLSTELHEARVLRDFLSETQCADILLTQKWAQDRLWNLCFSHGLLQLHPAHPQLGFAYALDNAEKTMSLCRLLRISAIEAHGVGIIEKLYNIATSALLTAHTAGAPGYEEHPGKSQVQLLASKYLKLMTTLRGGNHPYITPYKANLMSFGWLEGNGGWES
ncbi:hypothetical protein BJX61DRAFT_531240 [Aspergillus egyptiacus]|nr:hypothetical protein BJX61DRAFT_531240 [Aspergillus egyptiacus]